MCAQPVLVGQGLSTTAGWRGKLVANGVLECRDRRWRKTMGARTGWVWHERYAWHDARGLLDSLGREALFEPEPSLESGNTKRRLRNLVDASGMLGELIAPVPRAGGLEYSLRTL